MQIIPIASSSDGNCTAIKSNGTTILIDCGVSLRTVTSVFGRDYLSTIAALFITHEHSDHVKGVPVLSRRLPNLPVFVHEDSFRAKSHLFSGSNRHKLESTDRVEIGSFVVEPFPTHHDSHSSHGFKIYDSHTKLTLCYIPDTGHICENIKQKASEADLLFIECDYDEQSLRDYPHYPNELKARIAGAHGHLCNREALDLVEEIGISQFRKIVLAHLSPRTNSPSILTKAIEKRFGTDHPFEIAGRTGSVSANMQKF